jgi:hypothetical protein
VQRPKYRHYKGGEYFFFDFVTHSETGEIMVLYMGAKDGRLWVRPETMFFEQVEVDGKWIPRFKRVD